MNPRVCDYEGSPYRRVFWEQADRSFEDAAERLAVRSMLPPTGTRLVDIGAGFGRLVDEYAAYDEVILLDYAESMLADARARHGDRCLYVCADLYRLPFATAALDTVVQVRVLHHVENVDLAFSEVARVLRRGGRYLLEFANKRHLKAIARYAAGRQTANPFDPRPDEFVPLNWNFHPASVAAALDDADLELRRRRAVSHFRLPALKRLSSPERLARLDHLLGGLLARFALAPSQFYLAERRGGPGQGLGLWRCPACGAEPLGHATAAGVACHACGRLWPQRDGVLVFRDTDAAT